MVITAPARLEISPFGRNLFKVIGSGVGMNSSIQQIPPRVIIWFVSGIKGLQSIWKLWTVMKKLNIKSHKCSAEMKQQWTAQYNYFTAPPPTGNHFNTTAWFVWQWPSFDLFHMLLFKETIIILIEYNQQSIIKLFSHSAWLSFQK